MSQNGNRVHTLGSKHFCTIEHAEELAHAAYLLATKERIEATHELVKAFEARIADLPQPCATCRADATPEDGAVSQG